jgi:hypothetical protein
MVLNELGNGVETVVIADIDNIWTEKAKRMAEKFKGQTKYFYYLYNFIQHQLKHFLFLDIFLFAEHISE